MKNVKSNCNNVQSTQCKVAREQILSTSKNVSDQPRTNDTCKPNKPQLHRVDNNIERNINTMNSTNIFDNLATIFAGIARLIVVLIRLFLVFIIGAAVIVNSYAFMSEKLASNPELAEDMPAIVELLENGESMAATSADFLLDVQTYWTNTWTSEAMTNPEADRSIGDEFLYQLKNIATKLRYLIVPNADTNSIEAN